MPRVLTPNIWVTAGCGLTLVGDCATGSTEVVSWDSSLSLFPSRYTVEEYGKPTYYSNHIYAWRNKIDATYDGAGTNSYHAYVANAELCTFDVTTRSAPSFVSATNLNTDSSSFFSGNRWRGDTALTGTTLFAVSFGLIPWQQAILSVIDVSTPGSPSVSGTHTLSLTTNHSANTLLAYTVSSTDYAVILVNAGAGASSIQIYDTSGTQVGSATMNWALPMAAQIVGTTLYVATYENFPYAEAWDISNPASPTQLGYYDPSADDINGLCAAGTEAFALFYFSSPNEMRVHAIDFTTPASPALDSYLTGSFFEGVYGTVVGDSTHVFVENDTQSAIKTIDSSDPTNMTLCSTDGSIYFNSGSHVWRTPFMGQPAGDGYVYAWGDDYVLVANTTETYDSHLAVLQIL